MSVHTTKKALVMSTLMSKELKHEMKCLQKYQQDDEKCQLMVNKNNKKIMIYNFYSCWRNNNIYIFTKQINYIILTQFSAAARYSSSFAQNI